ncbi:NAD-dependent epimerase/dehydratase family protein [Pseudomonas reactans]|jgi:nucleoside-diphosphate-sugar epimerase
MNVLVTGGNGYIGMELCRVLVGLGHRVSALVRSVSTPIDGIEYFVGDLADGACVEAALKNIECVVHLAGRAHVLSDGATNPLAEYRSINRDLSLSLAASAKEAGVARFLFISSIGVNGAVTNGHGFDEKASPAPATDYALSKLEAESGLRELLANSETEFVIIRPPLVYGINAPGNFARLVKLVSVVPVLPFGSIANGRSLISLRNLVDFIVLCIDHKKAANHVFLVCDGHPISTPDIVRALAEGLGKRCFLLKVSPRLLRWFARLARKESIYSQLCESIVINNGKACALLSWRPDTDTYEALKRLAQSKRDSREVVKL